MGDHHDGVPSGYAGDGDEADQGCDADIIQCESGEQNSSDERNRDISEDKCDEAETFEEAE